jgi:heptosyltransferase-3
MTRRQFKQDRSHASAEMIHVDTPVVIYRLGSLGDTIVALPSLHRIERSFPDAERIALTNFPVSAKASALESVLGSSGLIHRAMAYPVGMRSPAALWRLLWQLRALGSSTLVYLTPPRGRAAAWRDWLFFRLCGFTRIIGTPFGDDLQHSRVRGDGTLEPEYSRLARCMAALGPIDLLAADSWDLRLTADERAEAALLRRPLLGRSYVAVNMGGKVASNDWGVGNWTALLGKLGAMAADHGLLILGGAEDEARAATVARAWPGPVLNACGRANPRVSGAAVENATLFIGHDSGPMHLAACMGVPCIGLFGENNLPSRWHPPGPEHRPIHKMTGVSTITVDEVLVAARSILSAPHAEAVPAVRGLRPAGGGPAVQAEPVDPNPPSPLAVG